MFLWWGSLSIIPKIWEPYIILRGWRRVDNTSSQSFKVHVDTHRNMPSSSLWATPASRHLLGLVALLLSLCYFRATPGHTFGTIIRQFPGPTGIQYSQYLISIPPHRTQSLLFWFRHFTQDFLLRRGLRDPLFSNLGFSEWANTPWPEASPKSRALRISF